MIIDHLRILARFLRFASLAAVALLGGAAHAEGPKNISGLKNPESAAVGADGKVYVTVIGEREKKGGGSVAIVETSGNITHLRHRPGRPARAGHRGRRVVHRRRQERLEGEREGEGGRVPRPRGVPRARGYLNDIMYDGRGTFYLSDSGDRAGKKGRRDETALYVTTDGGFLIPHESGIQDAKLVPMEVGESGWPLLQGV